MLRTRDILPYRLYAFRLLYPYPLPWHRVIQSSWRFHNFANPFLLRDKRTATEKRIRLTLLLSYRRAFVRCTSRGLERCRSRGYTTRKMAPPIWALKKDFLLYSALTSMTGVT